MSGLGSGLAQLFKTGRKRIGKAIDNYLVGGADARKAINDEVRSKFQPMIEQARNAESKRADNIKDLGDKLNESKANWQKARDKWRQDRDNALADAKAQRQTDIDNYNAQSKVYSDALTNAKAGRDDILTQLRASEAQYDPSRTLFTDVKTGENYIFDPFSGYKSLNSLTKKEKKYFKKNYQNFDNRLIDIDPKSNNFKVINAFDESTRKTYGGYDAFNNYYPTKISAQDAVALSNAEKQITQAKGDFKNWKMNNSRPTAWDDTVDLQPFKQNFKSKYGSIPDEYNFNGQIYKNAADLDQAYNKALAHEQALQNGFSKSALKHISDRNAEIAKRIQDAKDIKKAKLFLGGTLGTLGAGALYAGAKAMYGGDDTDNTDNIDTTDNTYTGEPDPELKAENTPDGKAALNGRPLKIDADFNPDEAAAVLASGAYDQGAEDSNSIESSDDLGNDIGASTRGHTMEDRLYELIKAMKDPYKADAIANYIYSRHGNDPEVQNLGWRGWLNKYYGDSLRKINIDPSGYKGMHVSGGL